MGIYLGLGMRKLTFIATVGTALSVVVPASAADFVEPTYDWNGVYAGVFAGIGHTSSDWEGTDDDIEADPVDIDETLSETTALLGGLVGVNFQKDKLVFGAEADLAWFDSRQHENLDGAEGLDITSDINLLGSLRARLGYAEDRTLFYVTGGAAFADTKHTWNDGGSEDFNMPSKSVKLNFGWVVGAGIEHAWTDDWLVRLEGFYYDLGSKDRTVSGNDETDEFEVKQDIWVGRIGISYKLN